MNGLPALRQLPSDLTARRAWPHPDGLAVEARTATGAVVGVLITNDGVRLLAARDPALPALAPALSAPGTELLGHRPGRRAVVREVDGHYVKVVRPGRAGRVADGLREAAARLHGRPGAPGVPPVCAVDAAAGWVRLDELAGPSLHELLCTDPPAAAELCGHVAHALAAVRSAPTAELPRHSHAKELAVLQRWLDDADRLAGADLAARAAAVSERLRALPQPRWAPCHRDLHDKQLIRIRPAEPGGPTVGLLDLDTLCAADPALDPANLLAHLHLRTAQGHCTPATAARCARALHHPALDPGALQAYTAAALLRLAAVYTFRPGSPELPARLAAAATQPGPATWRTS